MGSRKPVVGLAGGIGSGKSEVARLLVELGGGLIDSDAVSREEIDDTEVRRQLVAWWGPRVLRPDGRINRSAVAEIVFERPDERARLEGVLHPRIDARRRAAVAEFERDPAVRFVIIDAPLLFEVGLDRCCDWVLFVQADDAVRAARVATTRGWSAGELRRRESAQWPIERKRSAATAVCENNGDVAALRRQVRVILEQFMASRG